MSAAALDNVAGHQQDGRRHLRAPAMNHGLPVHADGKMTPGIGCPAR